MYDILIVGSGGAGLSCALEAQKRGQKVAVITQSFPTNAATCMAQGGLNAAIYSDKGDSPSLHTEDTIKGAAGLADKQMVLSMCEGAKEQIEWLDSIGMPFSRNKDRVAQRKFGAASRDRTTYSQDYTGLKLLHTLYDNCLKEEIEFLDDTFVLDLVVEEATCRGVVTLKGREVEVIESSSVVLATGGYAGIYHGFTTNAAESTGDGAAMALRAGAKLSDMEFVQFHPTSLKNSSALVSESARGAGGFLVNENGERFIDELMTRDEVSRAVFLQIQRGGEVFLDIRHLGDEFISKNLPQEKKLIQIHENLNPSCELIPIAPAAHYSMGGIDVDRNLQTSIKSLYAIGECSNTKIHGANRLGGNSLLEIVYFGRAVVPKMEKSSLHVEIKKHKKIAQERVDTLMSSKKSDTFFKLRDRLGEELFNKAGIFREKKSLEELWASIEQIEKSSNKITLSCDSLLVSYLKFKNSLEVAKIITLGAINREESRGAHYRDDFKRLNSKALHSYIVKKDSSLHVEFEK
jgi:succinate dehydrogenase / fumarate reductase flavoprotein subunit